MFSIEKYACVLTYSIHNNNNNNNNSYLIISRSLIHNEYFHEINITMHNELKIIVVLTTDNLMNNYKFIIDISVS
jgi:hypothetical protein